MPRVKIVTKEGRVVVLDPESGEEIAADSVGIQIDEDGISAEVAVIFDKVDLDLVADANVVGKCPGCGTPLRVTSFKYVKGVDEH